MAAPTRAKACVGSELVRVRVPVGTGDAKRPKTHVRGATPGELTSESSRGLYGLGSVGGGPVVLPGWLRERIPGERLKCYQRGQLSQTEAEKY